MPIFDDDDTQESFKANGSGFQFSGVSVSNLGASEYTLVGIACDRSSSVYDFASEIEGCLKNALEGCQRSPRVDNLLTRVLAFNQSVEEVHGFRPLADCPLASYNGFLKPGGSTALYDATVNLVDSVATYGKVLMDQEYTANGIVIVLTDGMDVGSTLAVTQVKEAIQRARRNESLESVLTILIGVNVQDPQISQGLSEFKDKAGFDQYVEVKDASPKTLAKVAGFISKSVSSQSQALGTGGPSQTIQF